MLAETPTPSYVSGAIESFDARRLIAHPRRLLAAGCVGVLVALAAGQFMAAGATYRAHAIVGMSEDAYSGLSAESRVAAEQSSVAAVLSKGVFVRASEALLGKTAVAPEPGFFERLAVAAGLAEATSQKARIAQNLAARVAASQGPVPGTVAIEASDDQAEGAASVANAVAAAFMADQDDGAAGLRRARDAAGAAREQALNQTLDAARRRLVSFGPTGADPVQARADAARTTGAAKARLDAFRTVIASGSPPLGAEAGLPPSIAPLQGNYLDLKRQLLEAQRTYGERHTIVIGLEDGLRLAGKSLTAEWKRLADGAASAWTAARDREAALAKAETSRDAATSAAAEDARRAVAVAEQALVRFKTARSAVELEDRHFRLIAPAAIPTEPSGVPLALRTIVAILVGLAAASLVHFGRRGRRGAARYTAAASAGLSADDTVLAPSAEPMAETIVRHHEADSEPDGVRARARPTERPLRTGPPTKPRSLQPKRSPMSLASFRQRFVDDEPARLLPLSDFVSGLARLDPGQGVLPTVLIGSSEAAAVTMPVALSLARAAAAAGQRVLLIESARPQPLLASVVPLQAQPVLVDVHGTLRIALRDDQTDGLLYLAPAFPDMKRFVAGLARRPDVLLIDESDAAFDVAIVDGGTIDSETGRQWSGLVDASIRIARFASERDDETFLHAIGGSYATFLGTVAPALPTRLASKSAKPDLQETAALRPATVRSSPVTLDERLSKTLVSPQPVPRTAVRRRVGSR